MGRYVSTTDKQFAAESGHYYHRDGTPAYTIIGKNGKERPTTLRDARSLGLLPSVTTIIKCAAAPGLEAWKQRQILLAALTLPRIGGETEDEYLTRIMSDSKEEAKQAADRGTQIHAAIEQHFRGEPFDLRWGQWVEEAAKAIHDTCGAECWSAEKSFASPNGYGGKVDLHSARWVIDYKSKEGDLSDVAVYDEHMMQLAAYRDGLRTDGPCGILFVSRDEPKVRLVPPLDVEIERGARMFYALLDYWYGKTGLERP